MPESTHTSFLAFIPSSLVLLASNAGWASIFSLIQTKSEIPLANGYIGSDYWEPKASNKKRKPPPTSLTRTQPVSARWSPNRLHALVFPPHVANQMREGLGCKQN